MSFIHVLDDNTINKIAAGEVVERPASVVKELAENAIDAKADRIEVEITTGGTSFMRVTDNGIGMSREDAERALLRHATSKITKAEDLLAIDTLGFRGEALPSIASVSRFSLQTRQAGAELGTEITLSGGKEQNIQETGCSLGTTIKVEDLFFNTPARKKFLKTNTTEGNKINEFIIKLAVSKPHIAFKFINNNKLAISTPGNGSVRDTLLSIYGKTVGDGLLPLEFRDEDLGITGFVSKPSVIRSNRSWQIFIVNGRIISSRAIAKAIDNAYHALIPRSGYPLVVLDIQVPQHTIDVNVHPQKTEMKFEDEGRIFKAVYKAVLDAVHPKADRSLHDMAAQPEKPQGYVQQGILDFQHRNSWSMYEAAQRIQQEKRAMPWEVASSAGDNSYSTMSSFGGAGKNYQGNFPQWDRIISTAEDNSGLQVREENPKQREDEGNYSVQEAFSGIQCSESETGKALSEDRLIPIGQVDETYIIAQNQTELYIVDQHAAHERILFDRFSRQAADIPVQQLLVHPVLDFAEDESRIIEENLEMLGELGFDLEPGGPRQFRLLTVPADVPAGEAEDFIREILGSLQELHKPSAAELRKAAIATTACKAAIKAGFKLNTRQMELLLQELEATEMPYTCPHGRPTIIKFTSGELAKMFKRTGF